MSLNVAGAFLVLGDHKGRPYKTWFFVGAGDPSPKGAGLGSRSLVPALARTSNGSEQNHQSRGHT
jgi:hypothetical protein